jgi:hypothetical protein
MCEAVVPELKPLNVTWTLSVLATGSNTTVADPRGGNGSAFVRLAVKVVGFA